MKVWERSKNLAVEIYKLTDTGKLAKNFGLKDQIRRSAVSVPSNIALLRYSSTSSLTITAGGGG